MTRWRPLLFAATIIFAMRDPQRDRIRHERRSAEAYAVAGLLGALPGRACSRRVTQFARALPGRVGGTRPPPLSAEAFLRHYGLSTREGVALMCIAEALLRIPDAETADALLREKLSEG